MVGDVSPVRFDLPVSLFIGTDGFKEVEDREDR